MRITNTRTIVIIHDLFMAAAAWQLSWFIRFNFELVSYPDWKLSLYALPMIVLVQGLVSYRFGLYRGMWRFASLPDLWNIFRVAIIGALSITLVLFLSIRLEGIPRSILILRVVREFNQRMGGQHAYCPGFADLLSSQHQFRT